MSTDIFITGRVFQEGKIDAKARRRMDLIVEVDKAVERRDVDAIEKLLVECKGICYLEKRLKEAMLV
jgi:hypothetical protein